MHRLQQTPPRSERVFSRFGAPHPVRRLDAGDPALKRRATVSRSVPPGRWDLPVAKLRKVSGRALQGAQASFLFF